MATLSKHLRDWSRSYRDRGKYTPVGVTFHWVMAGLVMFQLGSGWWMQRYLVGPDKLDAYQAHSSIGLTILLFGALRLWWRLIVPGPINDADKGGWRSNVAHLIHAVFYMMFVLLPLSGWALWSAIQPTEPLYLAGLVPIPEMPFHDLSPTWQFWILDVAEDIHVTSVIVLAVFIPAHALAAIKHHFWDQDDVFEGMLPEVPDTNWSLADGRHRQQADQSPALPGGG